MQPWPRAKDGRDVVPFTTNCAHLATAYLQQRRAGVCKKDQGSVCLYDFIIVAMSHCFKLSMLTGGIIS